MLLHIPDRLDDTQVSGFIEASRVYSEMRDASGEGMRTWPDAKLYGKGGEYRISYNGNIWLGATGNADLIYCPRWESRS